ncbi:MAG: methyltransferase family protein [Gaiella sp.]
MSERGRGGGWVVTQFALLALVPVAAFLPPAWPDDARWLRLALGALLVVSGVAVVVWAARAMGRSMTPFPRPVPDAALVDTGPYAYVRHPVYSGALVLLAGIALLTSPAVLVLVVALAALWVGKARVEEEHLLTLVPGYPAYRDRVVHRIVPGVY